MPRIQPFQGVRYDPARVPDITRVTAPPYDVLSEADRSELAAKHPNNIVHVDVPLESDGTQRYENAARLLD